MNEPIPLVFASLGEQELTAVADVFRSGWPAGQGPCGRALEARLIGEFGVADAVAVSSCGAALHLAMLALDVDQNDEVIVADYTFPAPAQAVLHAGATPVFADVRAETQTIDPKSVHALITPRTAGIIAVDAFGLPADYEELRQIADRYGLFVIEDAACAVEPLTKVDPPEHCRKFLVYRSTGGRESAVGKAARCLRQIGLSARTCAGCPLLELAAYSSSVK